MITAQNKLLAIIGTSKLHLAILYENPTGLILKVASRVPQLEEKLCSLTATDRADLAFFGRNGVLTTANGRLQLSLNRGVTTCEIHHMPRSIETRFIENSSCMDVVAIAVTVTGNP